MTTDPQAGEEYQIALALEQRRAEFQRAVEEAIRLFESDPDFPRVQVRMRERMEEATREAPSEARGFGSGERLRFVLRLFDIRAEAFGELLSDIRRQNAFMLLLESLKRCAWQEFTGFPIEVARPASAEAEANLYTIHEKVQEWTKLGYKRLDSHRNTQVQPETQVGPGDSASVQAARVNAPKDDRTDRRKAVDAYIEEVLRGTGKRITRTAIWTATGDKKRTEFERWESYWYEKCHRKPNSAANRRFTAFLAERPHLK